MESFLSRYRNLVVLVLVLLVQVIGLAVQVRKPATAATGPERDQHDGSGVRLIRLWAADIVSPFERAMHGASQGTTSLWAEYIDLHRTRQENKDLKETVDRLRLEQAMLREDAMQGQRLQGLLKFQENYVYATTPAQVIGSSGNMQSRVIWLDKGSSDGLATDMAVITPEGIAGKVRDVFSHTAQVLLINDQTSGAGVVLETTRIRGILRGNAAGQPQVINILADQRIKPGEPVLTAGGDQIFPRGLPVGTVERVDRDPERGSFINVVVKPAANLQHLDEVLVVTSLQPHLSAQQQADLTTSEELKGAEVAADAERKKAAAEMAERLPSLTDANSPAAKPQLGPDGKPLLGPDGKPLAAPFVPQMPKPIPAKHPDRFSPGGSSDATPDTSGDAQPDSATDPAPKEKPASPAPKKPAPRTPNAGRGRAS